MPARCGGAARRPLGLALRRHRTGDEMPLATHLPGFAYREQLTRTRQQPKGKINMSARNLIACSLESAFEQTVATGHQAPESLAAENPVPRRPLARIPARSRQRGLQHRSSDRIRERSEFGNGFSRKSSRNGACGTQLVLSEPAQRGKADHDLRSHHAYAMGKAQNHRANRSRGRL